MNEEGETGDVYDMDEPNEYIIVRNIIVMPRRRVCILLFSFDRIREANLKMIKKRHVPRSLLERACKEYVTGR